MALCRAVSAFGVVGAGIVVDNPATNEALREEVGDYRISMAFDTASVSFDSAVALQDVIYDNFSADPEWTGGFLAFNPPTNNHSNMPMLSFFLDLHSIRQAQSLFVTFDPKQGGRRF